MPPKASSVSKSPAPRGKAATRSKSPPPPPVVAATKKAATSASPPKASPKRAASATKVKTPAPKKAAGSVTPKPSAKKSKKEVEDDEAKTEKDAVESDDEIEQGDDLPPQTQNQLSQNSTSSPAAAAVVVAVPAPASSTKNNKKQQLPSSAASSSVKQQATEERKEKISYFAPTHDSAAAKKETEEVSKRCTKLPEAVHAMFTYLKKKAADLANNSTSTNRSSTQQQQQQQQQQNTVDDVLALFGPQSKSNNLNAASSTQGTADVPIVEVSVEFSFLRAPKPSRVPWSIVLPNAVHDIDKSICLITPAPQEKYRNLIEDENAKVQAPANIQKIMDVDKLEGRFQDPVALRALAKSYSGFWVHNEVDAFPRVLTGEFMSHHFPIWVNGQKSLHINERLQRTLGCVMLPRQGHDNVTVVVGHTKQSEAQLTENIRTFCGNVVALLHDSWKDVLSIRLSFRDFATGTGADRRVVLPVYAHDFRESCGLGTAAVSVPKALRLPSNIRSLLVEEKESGKIRSRQDGGDDNGQDGAVEEKKDAGGESGAAAAPLKADSAATGAPAATTTATSKKSTPATTTGPKKPANNAEKKDVTKQPSDDEDDEIPQIDVSVAAAVAVLPSKSSAAKKPAPKAKKAAGKK